MKNYLNYPKRLNRSLIKLLILTVVTVLASIMYPAQNQLLKPPIVYAKSTNATETIEQVVDVNIKTTISSLDEYHPGKIYLLIKNKFNKDILISQVCPIGPDFIDFVYSKDKITISPHQTQILAIEIKTQGQVLPGKHLFLFNIFFQWKDLGKVKIINLVSFKEINVGVIGESEILKLLGVPSLLVLPGFLMLVTVKIFWELNNTKDKNNTFPLKTISPEFWFIAITLSIPMIFLYPIITERVLKIRRSYLETYGPTDVLLVWVSSILLAAALYLISIGSINLYKIWRIKQDAPSPEDDPVTILYKLDKQGLGVALECVNLKGIEQPVFLLESTKDDKEKLWVAPPIILEWLKGSECKTLREDVSNQLTLQGKAKTLANLLKKGEKIKALRVDWQTGSNILKPKQVKSIDITNYSKDIFVKEK